MKFSTTALLARGCPTEIAAKIEAKAKACPLNADGTVTLTFDPSALVQLASDLLAGNWGAVLSDVEALFANPSPTPAA